METKKNQNIEKSLVMNLKTAAFFQKTVYMIEHDKNAWKREILFGSTWPLLHAYAIFKF